MPLWLIATGLGIALPMLFKKDSPQPQTAQAGGPAQPQGGNYFPGGVQPQFPPVQSYPIPFDATIDPQSAYAVFQAWKTAPAATLRAFAQEIFRQFPIAGACLFARAVTIEEFQAATQAAQARLAAQQAQAQQAQAQQAQAQAPAVTPPQAFAGGTIPATQVARIVPTPNIQPQGAELANGTAAPAAPQVQPQAPAPQATGVG
jgi:hypothetical protein